VLQHLVWASDKQKADAKSQDSSGLPSWSKPRRTLCGLEDPASILEAASHVSVWQLRRQLWPPEVQLCKPCVAEAVAVEAAASLLIKRQGCANLWEPDDR